jgi:hypothetical protein
MQPSVTAEVVEALEDSQMTLASLAANRYAAPFREDLTSWLSKLASVSEQVDVTPLTTTMQRIANIQFVSSHGLRIPAGI